MDTGDEREWVPLPRPWAFGKVSLIPRCACCYQLQFRGAEFVVKCDEPQESWKSCRGAVVCRVDLSMMRQVVSESSVSMYGGAWFSAADAEGGGLVGHPSRFGSVTDLEN